MQSSVDYFLEILQTSSGAVDDRQDSNSHRPPSFHHRNTDLIVVLEGSRIVEKGPHQQLMKDDGSYKRLIDIQMDNERVRPI